MWVRNGHAEGHYDATTMHLPAVARFLRALVCLVVAGLVLLAPPAAAQDEPEVDAVTTAECTFTKADAIEANGEPLGPAIWGRLCQVIDDEAAFAAGVTVTVSRDGAEIGEVETGDDGVFVIEIPENGVYQVAIDTETLPEGFSLTSEGAATLDQVRVNLGDQQAHFRMGERSGGGRNLQDYATMTAKGLRLGLVIGVAAMGLSLVFGVTGLVNFSHAELVTFGAVVAYGFDRAGIPFWLAIIPALLLGAGLGAATDRVIWKPLRDRRLAMLSVMVVSIGLSTFGRHIIQVVTGVTPRRFTAASGQREKAYLGLFRLTTNDLIVIVVSALAFIAMILLLRRTRLGTAIRAVSDNADLAASSGIDVDHIIRVVWALCGGLAALGGILYGLTVDVRFDMGFVLLLSMFAAVVLGGLGSAYGAMLGAIVVAFVQEMSGLFIDTSYKFATSMAVLILVLLIRPQGILGKRERFG